MKVLHLASFEGNLGDNANIAAFQAALVRHLGLGPFTALEMREFYWKQRRLDHQFAALANAHDLVIIGGGNYFEVWVEQSCSGMSVDMPFEVLESIKTPILFYGLGFDPGMGYSVTTLARSKAYFEYLLERPRRYLVTVRNDGSIGCLNRLHGEAIASRIIEVPDGGFLMTRHESAQPWLPTGQKYVAINLAGDMLNLRHPGGERLDSDGFCGEFAGFVRSLCEARTDYGVVFIPHIYSDLPLISRVIELLPDPLRRRRVYVAPYTHGAGPHDAIFDLYVRADAALGVRYHANVCPIALGTPTLGLVNYPQIAALYDLLGIPERAVSIREPGFAGELLAKLDRLLDSPAPARRDNRRIRQDAEAAFDAFLARFQAWIQA